MTEMNPAHLQLIAQHGWALVSPPYVQGQPYRYGYTVGLSAKGLAEQIVIVPANLHENSVGVLLSESARLSLLWNRSLPRVVDLGHDLIARTRWLTVKNQKLWLPLAEVFAKGTPFTAQQLFLPDSRGRYPWQPDCEMVYRMPML